METVITIEHAYRDRDAIEWFTHNTHSPKALYDSLWTWKKRNGQIQYGFAYKDGRKYRTPADPKTPILVKYK